MVYDEAKMRSLGWRYIGQGCYVKDTSMRVVTPRQLEDEVLKRKNLPVFPSMEEFLDKFNEKMQRKRGE